jgi:hypothetical protein
VSSAGTESERIYKAVIRKREAETADFLMVVDKRGRIAYITTKVRVLLLAVGGGLLLSRSVVQHFRD